MEVYIEIWTKGTAPRNERPDLTKPNHGLKYYHLWIKDDDKIHAERDLWNSIVQAIREMEQDVHRHEQDGFPNFSQMRDY